MTSADAGDAPLGMLSDHLMQAAEADRVTVGAMLQAAGRSAYGPLLLLLAVITLTPIGAIPGASILTGIVLVVLGAQMLTSRGCPWVPSWIERRSVDGRRLRQGLEKARPVMEKVDRLPRPRLQQLVGGGWAQAVAAGVVLMGLLMFPLAFVPWGVTVPGIALLVVGLGLMGRDGLLIALGLVAVVAATSVSAYLLFTTFGG